LISAPLGGTIHSFSDEFFADAINLLTPTAPISRKGHFVSTGAWYDGWETRRHNAKEYDWVIIKLGVSAGVVSGIEIDTAFFNGNQAPEASVEGIFLTEGEEEKLANGAEGQDWIEILPKQTCRPSYRHGWALPKTTTEKFNYVRLRQYPDGGIARFRLYGTVIPVFPVVAEGATAEPIDLAAATLGGIATSCSDQHFGGISNLILPGRGKDMGDGWETSRSRGGDHTDWAVIQLATEGSITGLTIDTKDFKGNFPRAVRIDATNVGLNGSNPDGSKEDAWTTILKETPCQAHFEHKYGTDSLIEIEGKTWTHIRMVIFPDGGVKRVRVFGHRKI
jgi:allantoicase